MAMVTNVTAVSRSRESATTQHGTRGRKRGAGARLPIRIHLNDVLDCIGADL